MNPPSFDNEWVPVLMLYGWGFLIAMLRVNYMSACERAGKGLTLREWIRRG